MSIPIAGSYSRPLCLICMVAVAVAFCIGCEDDDNLSSGVTHWNVNVVSAASQSGAHAEILVNGKLVARSEPPCYWVNYTRQNGLTVTEGTKIRVHVTAGYLSDASQIAYWKDGSPPRRVLAFAPDAEGWFQGKRWSGYTVVLPH
jgi:hypothetical protein